MPATPSNIAKFGDVLKGPTGLISWILTQMTTFTKWILDNELAMMYLSIFIAGIAIAFLFRILKSV